MSTLREYLNPAHSIWGLAILIALVAVAGGVLAAYGGPIAAAAVFAAMVAAFVVSMTFIGTGCK